MNEPSPLHSLPTGKRKFLKPALQGGLLVLLLISLGTIYIKGIQASPLSSNILVFTVMNLNIILVILTLSLITRNLIKLYFERTRTGARSSFRTRLTGAFVGISLIPSVILFFVATVLLSNSIETWFSHQADRALNDSLEIEKQFYEQEKTISLNLGKSLAEDISSLDLSGKGAAPLLDALVRKKASLNLEGVDFYFPENRGRPVSSGGAFSLQESLTEEQVRRGLSGEEIISVRETTAGRLLLSGVPVKSPDGAVLGMVVVHTLIPPGITARMEDIFTASNEYRQFREFKNPIKGIYILAFLIITLVIIFFAIWFGLYIAKGITVPLLKLSEGTEAVAQGNLNFRINLESSDEIGVVVNSFNKMTEDLKLNKEQLEEANRSLKISNLELEKRRTYIETILENIGTGVISINQEGVIRTFNRSAETILNLKASDLIGKSYREGFKPLHLTALVRSFERRLEKQKTNLEDEIQIRIDQKIITLKVIMTSLYDNLGEFHGVVIVFDNLSDLIKAQKVAAWQEVARRLAHEIKNPLTPIQLATQRLRKKYFEKAQDLETVMDESTKIILNEVNSLKAMVDEFTQFARMPVSRPEPLRLHPLLQDVIFLYQNAHKDVRFHRSFDDALPVVHADPEQMKRVFINLFENALEAVNLNGEIWVRTSWQNSERRVQIEIADNGIGIEAGDLDKLFLPYFSKKKEGTGLGLAIVHRIISDHHGTIRIENNSPKGTKVIIELPATA
ncbi:MAG TPA: ATP-binding protein [Nitrospiria bacterium]|nr:ATP-binding protein [Nitrospiria bacterium]